MSGAATQVRPQGRRSALTGARVTALILVWLVVVWIVAPGAGIHYEALAAWLTLPPLGLVYTFVAVHRPRRGAVLAVAATVVAALVIAAAWVMPHAAAV